MELALPRVVLGFRVIEVAPDEARVQVLDDVPEPALGEEQDLIGVRALAELLGEPGDDRAAVDRQAFRQRLVRDAFLRVAASKLSGLGVILGPRQVRVRLQGAEERPEELDRHADQLVGPILEPLDDLGLDCPDRLGSHHPALGGVIREPVRHLGEEIAGPLCHIGAL